MSHRIFVERLLIALVIVGLALLMWQLRSLLTCSSARSSSP